VGAKYYVNENWNNSVGNSNCTAPGFGENGKSLDNSYHALTCWTGNMAAPSVNSNTGLSTNLNFVTMATVAPSSVLCYYTILCVLTTRLRAIKPLTPSATYPPVGTQGLQPDPAAGPPDQGCVQVSDDLHGPVFIIAPAELVRHVLWRHGKLRAAAGVIPSRVIAHHVHLRHQLLQRASTAAQPAQSAVATSFTAAAAESAIATATGAFTTANSSAAAKPAAAKPAAA
jgi:hypothetical protein